jgi:signal transduction histidine kinase
VLGGSIRVESRVGEGTQVIIELPRVAPAPG